MISTFKTDYIKITEEGEKKGVELRGLSTDPKPTEGIENGSIFIEIDTGKFFMYDGENQLWKEI